MSKMGRRLLLTGLVFFAVFGFQTVGHAVLAFLDGESYSTSTRDYKLGYSAGSLDMLRALQDAGKLQPVNFNDQAKAITNRFAKKVDTDIDAAYVAYLKKYPKRRDRSAASAIYNAMREICRIP